MEIFKQTNFDFLGKKWPFIGLSLALTVIGVISLIAKGGPRYGIDFTCGALIDVGFVHRPSAQAIRAAVRKSIPGEIQVQEVSGTQEILIQSGLQDEKALSGFRTAVVSALTAAFNPNTGKLDINSATSADLADRLRDPLARANVSLSDDQLQKYRHPSRTSATLNGPGCSRAWMIWHLCQV
jgi:preprotein translocase subunit SecF